MQQGIFKIRKPNGETRNTGGYIVTLITQSSRTKKELKKPERRDAWLPQSVEPVTLYLGVMSLSSTMGMEPT